MPIKVNHKCENCGKEARWRIADNRPYRTADYLYYCDKCKEEQTIKEK